MGDEDDSGRTRAEDSGVYGREYPDEAFREALDPDDYQTTVTISETVGCAYETAYRRLNTLAEEGDVERDQFGGSYVWRLCE